MSHNRLTRKEIKRDAVMETLTSVVHWLGDNTKNLLVGFAVLLLAILAAAGFYGYRQGREEDAAEKLNEAMRVQEAEVGEAGAGDVDGTTGEVFRDAASRNERARQKFEELQTEYSGTAAARIADVFLGEIAATEGSFETARAYWQDFVDRQGDHMLANTVRVNLMSLDRIEGRSEELAGRLQEQLDGDGSTLPADVLLFQLAVTQEDLGDDAAAQVTWSQLAEEHPGSPFALQARARSGATSLGLPAPGSPFPGS